MVLTTVIISIYSVNNLVFTIEALCVPCVIGVTWLITWGGGGGKIDNGYWELRCLFSEPRKTRVFHFFCLYTTKIIAYKMFQFFIFPSSTQYPKKHLS